MTLICYEMGRRSNIFSSLSPFPAAMCRTITCTRSICTQHSSMIHERTIRSSNVSQITFVLKRRGMKMRAQNGSSGRLETWPNQKEEEVKVLRNRPLCYNLDRILPPTTLLPSKCQRIPIASDKGCKWSPLRFSMRPYPFYHQHQRLSQ